MQKATIGRLIAGGLAVTVVGGAGASAAIAATTTSVDGDYRVATASLGDVDETLSLTGSIETKSERAEAFAVAGTVDAIAVTLGQHVDAGTTLATLSNDSLQDALESANSTLTTAQQKLETDLEAQTATTSSSTETDSTTSTASAAGAAGGTSSTTASSVDTAALQQAIAAVQQRQQALLAAIDAADTALQTAATDEQTATTAAQQAATDQQTAVTDAQTATGDCATVTDATNAGYVDVSKLDPSDPDYAAKLAAAQTALTACQTDDTTLAADQTVVASNQATVAADQTAVQSKQAAVETAGQDLDSALQALQSAAASSGGDTSGSGTASGDTAGSQNAGTGAAAADSGSSGSSSTQTASAAKPSAADIVADRAAITAAQAQVAIAQQDLDAHTLTAGIAGTVAAIDLTVGESVSAGSTSATITILGDDGYTITTTVPLTQIAEVKTGETAKVTLPALGKTYDATVSTVGIVDVATDSTTPSYDVTLAVDANGDTIRYGSAAQAIVDVASVTGVLTVPLSAVTTSGGVSSVEVLKDGKTSTVTVKVGAVGADLVEIDSGLSQGDEVVLADLTKAVPSSTTSSTSSGLAGLTSGTSSLGGGSFPAGGPGGGFGN